RVELAANGIPRDEAAARRHPAVVVDAAVDEHLEVLRPPRLRSVLVRERLEEARAFDRLLFDAVEHRRRGDADRLLARGHDVDDTRDVRAPPAFVFDLRGPGDDHGVRGAAEVAGYLLGPLERRAHRVRPGAGEVVVPLRPADLVDVLEVVLPLLR